MHDAEIVHCINANAELFQEPVRQDIICKILYRRPRITAILWSQGGGGGKQYYIICANIPSELRFCYLGFLEIIL